MVNLFSNSLIQMIKILNDKDNFNDKENGTFQIL